MTAKTLADARPVEVTVGEKAYRLHQTLEAADAIEAAYDGIQDAIQVASKFNRHGLSRIILLCHYAGRSGDRKRRAVTNAQVKAVADSLHALDLRARSDVAAIVINYLSLMLNGFQPFDNDDEDEPSAETSDTEGNPP